MAGNEFEVNYGFVTSNSPSPIFEGFESIATAVRRALTSGAEESRRAISELWDVHDASVVWRALLRLQAEDKKHYSLLHVAVASGRNEIIQVILSGLSAAADTPTDPQTRFLKFDFLHARTSGGQTALHYAVFLDRDDVLELLMRTYDKIPVEDRRPQNLWLFADCCWMTPLHYAVLRNQKAKMELLLRWEFYRKHVNARDFFRRTPLHLSACHRPVSVERFLGCDDVDINAVDCVGHSPLHWAVCFGRADVVKSFSALQAPRTTFRAIDVDIEGRSILEMVEDKYIVGESLDLEGAPEDPLFCDSLYVMDNSTFTHESVGGKIQRMLMTIPGMKSEKERMNRDLQLYTNIVSSIFVVAALIGNATYAVNVTDRAASQSARDNFFFLNTVAFYISVTILTLGVGALYYSKKASRGRHHMKRTEFMMAYSTGPLGYGISFFLLAFYISKWTSISHSRQKLAVFHFCTFLTMFKCFWIFHTIRRKFAFIQKGKTSWNQPKEVILPYYDAHEQAFGLCGVYPRCKEWLRLNQNALQAHEMFLRVRGYAFEHSLQLKMKGAELNINLEARLEGAMLIEDLKKIELEQESRETERRRNFVHFLQEVHVSDVQRGDGSGYSSASANFLRLLMLALLKGTAGIEDLTSKRMANVPISRDLAVDYWRQRRARDITIQLFEQMERKLHHVESVYKIYCKDIGDSSVAGENARHLACFLSRLPHGILDWINTWTFPTTTSTYMPYPLPQFQGGSMAFLVSALTQAVFKGNLFLRPSRVWAVLSEWCTHVLGEVVEPLKFALILFYQGHALRIDFAKMQQVEQQVADLQRELAGYAKPAGPAVVNPGSLPDFTPAGGSSSFTGVSAATRRSPARQADLIASSGGASTGDLSLDDDASRQLDGFLEIFLDVEDAAAREAGVGRSASSSAATARRSTKAAGRDPCAEKAP